MEESKVYLRYGNVVGGNESEMNSRYLLTITTLIILFLDIFLYKCKFIFIITNIDNRKNVLSIALQWYLLTCTC